MARISSTVSLDRSATATLLGCRSEDSSTDITPSVLADSDTSLIKEDTTLGTSECATPFVNGDSTTPVSTPWRGVGEIGISAFVGTRSYGCSVEIPPNAAGAVSLLNTAANPFFPNFAALLT